MSQIPAYFPTIPFVGELPGGGRPNFVVKVKGKFDGNGRYLDEILHLFLR